MDISTSGLNIGIVGAGGFAAFAAGVFLQVPGIKIAAVADTDSTASTRLAHQLSAKSYTDYKSLLHDVSVSLVYVATPPFLHYPQSKAALLAGKHVICEKPAAIKTAEAEELVALARSMKLLYVVNLMQRYNPLCKVVRNIVKEKILGEFLHGFFENYARDDKLSPDHWFWDVEKSGGIFIEHGVHFFDLFSFWLGKGEIIHAAQWQRPGSEARFIDRVQATVNYPKGPVTFYHGFDQPKLLDRQEMRLEFERGDISLFEWVPVKLRLHGLLQNEQLEKLRNYLPGCSVIEHSGQDSGSDYASQVVEGPVSNTVNQKVRGRFKDVVFDHFITLEQGNSADKQNRYEQLLISMIQDQWRWILDNSAVRVTDDNNAVESLRIAETATKMAMQYQPWNSSIKYNA
jgi:predicted dehydrogenase/succinate dehydrogenase flavin-adding protein (antitoxin of CptAB toxin-antitoxin module)